MQNLASVKSSIIMDYGNMVRASIHTNHCHDFGLHNQQSYVKLEGTTGAIKINMGLLQDYPAGTADLFEYVIVKEGEKPEWKTLPVEGTWFPHAFIGPMAEMMRAAEDPASKPDNSVEDAIFTMACVEAAYLSDLKGGVKLSEGFNRSSL
jgi:predicted dehydrogenase